VSPEVEHRVLGMLPRSSRWGIATSEVARRLGITPGTARSTLRKLERREEVHSILGAKSQRLWGRSE